MNRRTKKKLKKEIQTLKSEVFRLTISEHINNMYRIKPEPFTIQVAVPMYRCLYPEQAQPILRHAILRELGYVIDDFIEQYRDDITENHVAIFKFIPTYRKETK